MDSKKKIIINFCPTGMVPTKSITPNVPISASEIIEQTHQAYEIGITIAHLHVRQQDESPCYKKSSYLEVFEGVRRYCPGLIICGSTSGRNFKEFEKRSEVIELMPDMCSLTLSSLNFQNQESINPPNTILELAKKMKDFGVTPELECFDLGMINFGKYLIRKNIFEGPFYWNLLFGNIAGMQSDFSHIGTAVKEIPEGHFIGLAGLAENQLPVNSISIAMGYGVRVGLEDNIWLNRNKNKLATNTELLSRVHLLMEIHERELFNSEELGHLGFYNKKKCVA
jgi:3-keto-5-aminohexanoate cleavage enzyme